MNNERRGSIGLASASVSVLLKYLITALISLSWLGALSLSSALGQEQGEAACLVGVPEGADPDGVAESGEVPWVDQEAPAEGTTATNVGADFGSNNPTGIAGIFNGNITTGCNYDPLTFNAKRQIDDIVVAGCVGAYPLRMTRYYNSRNAHQNFAGLGWGWSHEYRWFFDPDNGAIKLPGGAEYPGGLCSAGWPPISENWDKDFHNRFRLADGGTVMAGPNGNGPNGSLLLIDPFGKTTTIQNENNRISKVTEPGGRYLKFTYTDVGEPYGLRLTKVEAWDGRGTDENTNRIDWVVYNYTRGSLTSVQHQDGTSATYNYTSTCDDSCTHFPICWPTLKTAKDVRFNGPMREIEYAYSHGSLCGAHGAVSREKSIGSVTVSSVAGRGGEEPEVYVDDRPGVRTETTLNAFTRTFHYTPTYAQVCVPPPHEECPICDSVGEPQYLTDYTDFQGHTTYLSYDDNMFVNAVTDGRGSGPGDAEHTTLYTHDPTSPGDRGIGQITRITHPDGTHIDYQYESDPHYVHQVTDERGNQTIHTRDSTHNYRITRTDYKNSSGTLLAYETVEYDDAHFGLVRTHRMKNGAYVHYQYDSRGLLIDKWNATWSSTPIEGEPKTHYTYYGAGDPIGGNMWIDRVRTETDPKGNVTQYEYDRLLIDCATTGSACRGRGLVTKITYVNDTHNGLYPSGTSRKFAYNKWGDKVWEENELGQRTSYTNDDYGRVLSITDPLGAGHTETFDYTPTRGGFTSPYAHTTGSVKTHISKAGKVTTNDYDQDYRKVSTTVGTGNEAATTLLDYDEVGNQISLTDPRGGSAHTTTTIYDNRNRKVQIHEPLGHNTTFHYDDTSNVTSTDRPDGTVEYKEYDGLNRVTKTKVPMLGEGSDSNYVITLFDYYGQGGDQNGHSGGLLWKVTDGEGRITQFTYEPSGLKEAMIYPAIGGHSDTQTWAYDSNKNLIARKAPGGAIQTFQYDSRNRKTAMRWSNLVDFSDFAYDKAGRLNWAQNAYSTIVREYDSAGRMTLDQQTMPGAAPTPVPLIGRPTVVSRRTHGTAGTFDIELPLTGNPGVECRTGGSSNSYKIIATFADSVTLDGDANVSAGIGTVNSSAVAPIEGGGTVVAVDLNNVSTAQKLTVMLPVHNSDVSDTIAIPMRVLVGDVNHNGGVNSTDLAATNSHTGQSVTVDTFRYDINGDGAINSSDVSAVSANSGSGIGTPPANTTIGVHYEYDNDGRVTRTYIPNGNNFDYNYWQAYDSLGRLSQILTGQSAAQGTVEHEYAYDLASNVTQRINNVNLTSVTYTPDALNRIASLQINLPERDMGFGTPGTRDWFTQENYGYDAMNRLISVWRLEESAVVDRFGYYLDGQLRWADYGLNASNPTTTPTPTPGQTPTPTPTATPANQVAQPTLNPHVTYHGVISVTISTTTPGATIHYTLDNTTPTTTHGYSLASGSQVFIGVPPENGITLKAMAHKLNMTNSETVSAVYISSDGLNALSTIRRSVDYNLDKAGNRTGEAGVTENGDQIDQDFEYTVNALNQYEQAHSNSVTNGANHEITNYLDTEYTYLNDTRLAQASYSDGSGTHLYRLGYDALGRCVKRTTGESSVVYYIYDGEKPIYEFDPNGGTPSANVYGRGIDEIIARSNNGDGQYPFQDRLGSVIVVTGGDGSIREWYRYDAFGTPVSIRDGKGNPFTVTQINNRFMFTGREYAAQFGFYEYRARAYHPTIGRFMSEDPLLFDAGDYNLFRYVHNDPEDVTDPMGTITPIELDKRRQQRSAAVSDWVKRIKKALDKAMKPMTPAERQAFFKDMSDRGGRQFPPSKSDIAKADRAADALQAIANIVTLFVPGPKPMMVEKALAGEGTQLFRVFGNEAKGLGEWYSTVNPATVSNYRSAAGLFSGNSGQFVLEATLTKTEGVIFTRATPGPGGLGGGLPSAFVPNAEVQLSVTRVSGANPPF